MNKKPRRDKGLVRGPRKVEVSVSGLEQLRARHAFCITFEDIYRDVTAGRLPHYNPAKHYPVCDHPEDPVCASPARSDDYVRIKVEDARAAALVSDDEA